MNVVPPSAHLPSHLPLPFFRPNDSSSEDEYQITNLSEWQKSLQLKKKLSVCWYSRLWTNIYLIDQQNLSYCRKKTDYKFTPSAREEWPIFALRRQERWRWQRRWRWRRSLWQSIVYNLHLIFFKVVKLISFKIVWSAWCQIDRAQMFSTLIVSRFYQYSPLDRHQIFFHFALLYSGARLW